MTDSQNIINQTPTADSLTEPIHIKCTEKYCQSTFRNDGNHYLHMLKHHQINIRPKPTVIHFFCPETTCKYNVDLNKRSKFFLSKNLLRQHYFKVHATKTLKCKKCDKLFANETLMNNHERFCGQEFKCIDCDWTYKSREALLTHCKRKQHRITDKVETIQMNKLISISKPNEIVKRKLIKIAPKVESTKRPMIGLNRESKTTQTNSKLLKLDTGIDSKSSNSNKFLDTWNNRIKENADTKPNIDPFDLECTNPMTNDSTCQTDKNLNKINYPYVEDDSLNDFASELCHIETQTEFKSIFKENITPGNDDPMLYTHMHTQTSDDILSELGLTDIQTQTNWPSTDVSEMFVSTETQTSFTSRFLENTSTYTQTVCQNHSTSTFRDMENSSSSSSQSAYTQTVFENCLEKLK